MWMDRYLAVGWGHDRSRRLGDGTQHDFWRDSRTQRKPDAQREYSRNAGWVSVA